MAHFWGCVKGNRGEASRCGSRGSGLRMVAKSWEGDVVVNLYYDKDADCDMACVDLVGAHGHLNLSLYEGPVSGPPHKPCPCGCMEGASNHDAL